MLSKSAFIHFVLHGCLPVQVSSPQIMAAPPGMPAKGSSQKIIAPPSEDPLGGFGFDDSEDAALNRLSAAGPASGHQRADDEPLSAFGFEVPVTAPAFASDGFTGFARLLLEEAGFGHAEQETITVLKGTDTTIGTQLPTKLWYWQPDTTHPFQTLLVELTRGGKDLLSGFPDLKRLDLLEDALARVAQTVLRGFEHGARDRLAIERRGKQGETLVVISVKDDRAEGTSPVPLLAFATKARDFDSDNPNDVGLELFRISAEARHWTSTPAMVESHLSAIYDRHFKRLEGQHWQDAFVTADERKSARRLCTLCVEAKPDVKRILDGAHHLLEEISRSFGFEQRASAGNRRLLSLELPENHDIGMDAEQLEHHGLKNPFAGMTIRDLDEQLLGYLVYGLEKSGDAAKLRSYLEKHNRFHNVLVIYPENGQAVVELWHEKKCLQGRLRQSGERFAGTAKVVDMLSRFFVVSRSRIRNPHELAEDLAHRARYLRRLALLRLEEECGTGALSELYSSFKAALIHDMKPDDFVDAFAQTITYGLLTARWAGKDELRLKKKEKGPLRFTRATALQLLPASSPFLNGLFRKVLTMPTDDNRVRFLWLVDDIADLLNRIDVDYVFGEGDKDSDLTTDPVIHFYEPFLTAYDKVSRQRRGVYYTPRPVVAYIVQSAHDLLQTEFGLADGLADTTTWGEMIKKRPGLKLPPLTDEPGEKRMISPDEPFVQILDPATGTATFLVEVIDVVHRTLVAKWKQQRLTAVQQRAAWNDYVPKHLLPRLYAFELMMAPYAIAHMKIGLKLAETGYHFGTEERARIYLTNALEPKVKQLPHIGFDALAHEAAAVNEIKWYKRFTIVIGNPPYSNYSANLSPQARRIVDKYRTFHGVPIRERNQLQFERNIQDDFVKFISIAQDIINSAGVGVFGYITNGTMLASSSLRGMRANLVRAFSSLFELNLHGGGNEIIVGAEDDENVFDIVQSVAIHVYVRSKSGGTSDVNYAELLGRRSLKYEALVSSSVSVSEWRQIEPDDENCGFTPQDDAGGGGMRRLDSIFVKFGAGIKTNRDAVVIGFDDASLLEAVREFNASLLEGKNAKNHIRSLLYRPFDVRRIFYHEDVVASRSLPTMKHVVAGPNIGLVCSSTWTTPERFSVGISRHMVEMKTGTHDRGTTFFPFYRYESFLGGKAEQVHNLAPEFVKEWCATTHTRFVSTGMGDGKVSTGPDDMLFWLYGLFHSPEYRRRYRAALSQRFPIILLTSRLDLLRALCGLGSQLVALHLLESPTLASHLTQFVGLASSVVEKASWSRDTVWIDKKQTTGFTGVPEDVWSFHIGGYQVCAKWLKDRKDRRLSAGDIAHYQKIVVALSETIRLMKEIDQVIDAHGGWPGAFVTPPEAQKQ